MNRYQQENVGLCYSVLKIDLDHFAQRSDRVDEVLI